ncbi:hypothetical protein O9993_05095 [Vibrio lentus]|nr:hypothetical protein [Vibrio lentus]
MQLPTWWRWFTRREAGPSGQFRATSTSNTTNNSGFSAASYNFGSNNGILSWALIAGVVAVNKGMCISRRNNFTRCHGELARPHLLDAPDGYDL